jgi:hypothetical protein
VEGRHQPRSLTARPAPRSAPAASTTSPRATPSDWSTSPRAFLEQGGYCRVFEGQHELIDHILISHAILAEFQAVSTGNEKLPNVVEARPAARHDTPFDHSPAIATFHL